MIPISSIDNLFEKHIRDKVVELGYLPNLAPNQVGYAAALDSLRSSLLANESIIQVFGVGGSFDRGTKGISSIQIDRKNIDVGSVGSLDVPYHKDMQDSTYNKYTMYPNSSNINYEVRIITNNVLMERIMLNLVHNVLKNSTWLPNINDDGSQGSDLVEIRSQGSFVNVSIGNEYIEHVGGFVAKDVRVFDDTLIREGYVDITQITTDINVERIE